MKLQLLYFGKAIVVFHTVATVPLYTSIFLLALPTHTGMPSLSKHILANKQSFDKLKMTKTKSIFASIGFGLQKYYYYFSVSL